jgi:hypothetical protein
MSDSTSTTLPGSNIATDTDFAPFREISEVLRWAHSRWAPLAFAGLSISTILWIDFLKLYAIPVSFFSSGLLPALPALFATVTFVVMLLSTNAVMPAFLLWSNVHKDGMSLAAAYRQHVADTAKRRTADHKKIASNESTMTPAASEISAIAYGKGAAASPPHGYPDLVLRWLWLSVSVGLLWAGWIVVIFYKPDLSPTLVLPTIFGISLAIAVAIFWQPIASMNRGRPSWSFMLQFTGGIASQNIVAFSVLYIILTTTTDTQWQTLAYKGIVFLLVLVIIATTQLATATRVIKGPYKNMLKHACVGVIVVMAAIAAVQPVGALLATYPLRISGPDGHACMILRLTSPGTKASSVVSSVKDSKRPGFTVPLQFVTHFDDTYYVKIKPIGGAVYSIPSALVDEFDSCTHANAGSANATGAASANTPSSITHPTLPVKAAHNDSIMDNDKRRNNDVFLFDLPHDPVNNRRRNNS